MDLLERFILWKFQKWYYPAEYDGSVQNPLPINVTGPLTLKAHMNQDPTHQLTLRVYRHGSENPIGNAPIAYIDNAIYRTDPDGLISAYLAGGTHTVRIVSPYSISETSRWVFTQWGDGSTNNPRYPTLTGALTLTAYMKKQHLLATSVSPAGAGTVALNPAGDNGFQDEGASVQATATPNASYVLDYWLLDGKNVGGANPYAVSMDGSHNLTAVFHPAATITFSVESMGGDAVDTVLTVDGINHTYINLPKSFIWKVGSTHSFEWRQFVVAGSGKRYKWISATGLSTSRSESSFIVPSEGGSITAKYRNQYLLSVSRQSTNPADTTDPPPGNYWRDGDDKVNVTAVPAVGRTLDYWTLDGNNMGSVNPITVTMNTKHDLLAVFKDATYNLTVQVYKDGTSTPIQGVTVKIDATSYVTDSSGRVTATVYYKTYTIEVISPQSPSDGVRYLFTKWGDESTGNPRNVRISADTTFTAYMKRQFRLIINPPTAQSYAGFSDDFSGGLSQWTLLEGNFTILDGTLYCPIGSQLNTLLRGNMSWADYNFTVAIKAENASGYPGILLRYKDADNYVLIRLVVGSRVELLRRLGGSDTVVQNSGVQPQLDVWYTLKAQVKGSDVKVWIHGGAYNNTLIFDYDLGGSLNSGKVGVYCEWPPARWDNATLTLIDVGSISINGSSIQTPHEGWFDEGSTVNVAAAAGFGYRFDHWILDGQNVGSNNPYTVTMDATHELTAVFTPT